MWPQAAPESLVPAKCPGGFADFDLHKTWVCAVPKKNTDSYMHKSR